MTNLRISNMELADIKLAAIRYGTCRYQTCRYQKWNLWIEAKLQHQQAHQDPLALEMPRCPSHPAKKTI